MPNCPPKITFAEMRCGQLIQLNGPVSSANVPGKRHEQKASQRRSDLHAAKHQKKPRPTPPSPERAKAKLDEDMRDAAKRRRLDHELKTDRTAFIQRIMARTGKPEE
jgi:hypothetical protein